MSTSAAVMSAIMHLIIMNPTDVKVGCQDAKKMMYTRKPLPYFVPNNIMKIKRTTSSAVRVVISPNPITNMTYRSYRCKNRALILIHNKQREHLLD
jgi:hypothetical protein